MRSARLLLAWLSLGFAVTGGATEVAAPSATAPTLAQLLAKGAQPFHFEQVMDACPASPGTTSAGRQCQYDRYLLSLREQIHVCDLLPHQGRKGYRSDNCTRRY